MPICIGIYYNTTTELELAASDTLPKWLSVYFAKTSDSGYRCNFCDVSINPTVKHNLELLEHIKNYHKKTNNSHKTNPDSGFYIELLPLDVQEDGDHKNHAIVFGEQSETTTEENVASTQLKEQKEAEVVGTRRSKRNKKQQIKENTEKEENRKPSWVWKYFLQDNIIFRCSLCNVVLSINTNNMNRHIRNRHPTIYKAEALKGMPSSMDPIEADFTEEEAEEPCASEKETSEEKISKIQCPRRSWIWLYFNRTSATSAQCRLCNRPISHGGNATGNMNRHLKSVHNKTGDGHHWMWKVFKISSEDDFFSCKMCNYRCAKFNDIDRSIECILDHLKVEHELISEDQIMDEELEEEEIH